MGVGDIQGRDFVTPTTTAVENGSVNNYSFQKQQLQAPEVENSLEDNYPVKSNGSVNALQDRLTSVEEPVGEPQKHTYASIVCNSSLAALTKYNLPNCPCTDFLSLLFLEVASSERAVCTTISTKRAATCHKKSNTF